MTGNPQTISNLQLMAQMLATLVEQYRVDARQAAYKKLMWLKDCLSGYYDDSEKHLGIVLDRLLYFDTNPEFQIAKIQGTDSIKELLDRDFQMVVEALSQAKQFRRLAYDTDPDYTPDIYEHVIAALECQARDLEAETELMETLGDAGYALSRIMGVEDRNQGS